MFEEDKQNIKNKNTLRSEPKPMKRKVLAVLLSLCMLLPLLPVAAFAAEDLTFGESEPAKTFKPVPMERMSFSVVENTTMEATDDGTVTYTINAMEGKDWEQNSGEGSNQAYTYVGLYVEMPKGAVSLKQNFEGDPKNMDDVDAAFLATGKYESWYPVAESLGENGGAPFSLFSGGRVYTLLLEWYGADGKLLENGREYVKVTRELAEELVVAQTDDGLKYATLTGAVDAVVESEDKTGEVTLCKNSEGSAVGLFESKGAVDLTIDFGGFTYTCNAATGSPGTESQCLHLEKGNTVTLKNGTIRVADRVAEGSKECRMLIQNYCDLTLEDLTLIGSDVTSYLISSNYGDVVLRNVNVSGSSKNLIAAIDLMHWLNNSYRDKAPTLTIENSEENLIAGPIDVYCSENGNTPVACEEEPTLTVLGGTFTDENVGGYLSTDYVLDENTEDGTWTVVEAEGLVVKAESDGSNATASVGGSFAGDQSGEGVEADRNTVEVSVTTGEDGAQNGAVTSSAVTISANAMASIEDSTVKTVDIKTDVATLSVDRGAWSTMAEALSAVTLTVSVADKRGEDGGKLVYTLTAKDEENNDVFTESTGSITVSVGYTKGMENAPVVYYLSDKGAVQLNTVTYDKETGALSWSVNHFSDYEVADKAYEASVTTADGTTTTYATVEEALEAVATTGGTVNLLVDEATVESLSLTIAGNVKIKGTGTIDVTVKDVEGAEGKHTSVFTIQNTGSLTLDGVKMVVNGVQNEGQGSDGTAFTLYGNADGVGSEVFVINGGELDLRNLNKGFIMGGPAPSSAKVTVRNGVLNASGVDGNFSNGGEFVFDHAVVNIEAGVDKVSNYVGHALSVHKLTAKASQITASASKYGLNITDEGGKVELLEGSTLEVKDSGSKLEDGKAAANMQKGSTLVVDKTSTLSVTGTNNKLHLDEEGTSVLLGTVEAEMNAVPYIYAVGFKANAADAQATIQELYGAMGAPEDVVAQIDDCDDNTMFVLFKGTGTADAYTLTVTDEDGAEVYTEPPMNATNGGVIYFTFVQGGGSDTTKPIDSATYTLKVEKGEDVVGTTDITLAKVSFEPDGGVNAPDAFYGAAGDTVTLPADKPTKTGYNFAGWKAGEGAETFKAGAAYLMGSEDVTLTAQWNRRNSGGGAPSGGGGGSAATEYAVTVSTADNGSVAVSPKNAEKGDTVTVTVTPDEGYVLESLTVTDKDGDKVSTTKGEDGKYTFTMPGSTVTVKAVFAEEGTVSELPFEDVKVEQWFYEAVKYVYDNELMNGISATEFNPNGLLTRGTIAQVLFNLEGADADAAAVFDDVPADAWFADAVNWAAANNIVTGYGDGTFGPDNNITREQMAAILYRYAQFKGYDVSAKGDLTAFTDGDNVSEWATDALAWCVGAKLINGRDNGTVDATGTATRAEIAQIFMNFCENIAK